MPAKNKQEAEIRDFLVIDKPDDMRLIFSEKHNKILRLITDKELPISEVARALGLNPGSAHYHLKDLEKHGLVLGGAIGLVFGIRAKTDPELNRLYGEFEKLFLRYE